MAEVVLSPIIGELVKAIHEDAKQCMKLLGNLKDDLENINSNLQTINGWIEEYGREEGLENRLDQLTKVAHKVEDALDDWKAAKGDNEAAAAKVLSCFPSTSCAAQLVSNCKIAYEIKDINSKLDGIIDKTKRDLGLAPNHEKVIPEKETTSADFVESNLHGRDVIKKAIVDYCLVPGSSSSSSSSSNSSSSGVKVISVAGMAGMGKTALAQLVYKDEKIVQNFSRIWVWVPNPVDVNRVFKSIIVGLGDDKVIGSADTNRDLLLDRVRKSIEGKKFFLVLDDVWEDDAENWQCLINVLNEASEPGSSILLTTRKATTAKMFNHHRIFHLEKLSDDDCWKILSQIAFFGRDEKECGELEDVGKRISERCKGLPLTAKALGKHLKKTKKDIGSGELWRLEAVQNDIFNPLLRSYHDLPRLVRQCFKYCVTYRKDEVYLQSDLIYEWMALGYLVKATQDGDGDLEQKGVDYFEVLASRSFFQDVKMYDETNKVMSCKMHDIVHDFGKFLTRDQVMTVEIDQSAQRIPLDSKTRHLTLFIEGNKHPSVSISGVKTLHSLSITNSMSDDSLRDIFKQAKYMKIMKLCLPVEGGDMNVPEEIGNMVHLRYFRLWAPNKSMKLPDSMRKLRNLQYLNLKFHDGLIPKWIGELINLRELIGVVVSGKDHREGFSLGDLKNMKQLRVLGITFEGGNAIDGEEVKRAEFDKKTHLKVMKIVLVGKKWNKASVIKALKLPSSINLVFTKNDYHTIDDK